MKSFKIILLVFLILFLGSCGNNKEGESNDILDLVEKKEVKVNKKLDTLNIENNSNKNDIIIVEEVVFLNDNTKTGKEKINFIRDKLNNKKDIFKNKDNIKLSLDISLNYLKKKKQEEKREEMKRIKPGLKNIKEKKEKLKVEQEKTKSIIGELIEEKKIKLTEKLVYEGKIEVIEGNFNKALIKFKKAFDNAETNQDKANALAGEGDIYQEIGNSKGALNSYSKALLYDEKNIPANLGNAKYNIDQGLLVEANNNILNLANQKLLDSESIKLDILKSLILSLKGQYNESNKLLTNIIDNHGNNIDVYMLLLENNFYLAEIFNLNSIGLPLMQTTTILEGFKSKSLNYFNKIIFLDSNRAYAYFYHGSIKYLFGYKSLGINLIKSGSLLINNDVSLDTQEKKDIFTSYVDVVEKINIYNTTFDYSPAEFTTIVKADIGIFEKFYFMIDKYRLEKLTVKF